MTKHTPGPWIAEQDQPPHGAVHVRAEGEHICTLSGNAVNNARLVEAAPKMFAALKMAQTALKEAPPDFNNRMARAAVSDAIWDLEHE